MRRRTPLHSVASALSNFIKWAAGLAAAALEAGLPAAAHQAGLSATVLGAGHSAAELGAEVHV